MKTFSIQDSPDYERIGSNLKGFTTVWAKWVLRVVIPGHFKAIAFDDANRLSRYIKKLESRGFKKV